MANFGNFVNSDRPGEGFPVSRLVPGQAEGLAVASKSGPGPEVAQAITPASEIAPEAYVRTIAEPLPEPDAEAGVTGEPANEGASDK